jgi:hypothetical protein
MRLASAGRIPCIALALVASSEAHAQPAYFPAVSFGAVAIYAREVTLPSLSAGLGASLDLVTDDRVTWRVSATASAPVAPNAQQACVALPCPDTRHVSQIVSVTGDVAFRPQGSEARTAVVARFGQYRASPARTGDEASLSADAVSGFVAGLGVEADLGDELPRFRVSLHALHYRDLYRQHPWGFSLGLSAVLPR